MQIYRRGPQSHLSLMSYVEEDGDGLAIVLGCRAMQMQRWLYSGRQMGNASEEGPRRHGEERWQER